MRLSALQADSSIGIITIFHYLLYEKTNVINHTGFSPSLNTIEESP